MTKTVWQISQVVKIVGMEFDSRDGLHVVTVLRREATNYVAKNLHIDPRTVRDKYRRCLRPDISGVWEFDEALYSWLANGSQRLKAILVKCAGDDEDIELIEECFADGP